MRELRIILGRRALIVFLAFFVVAGTILGVPAATRTLADSSSPGNRGVSPVPAESAATEGLLAATGEGESILDPSSPPSLLQTGSGDTWTLVPTTLSSPFTPTARYQHAMAAIPSGVLLFGGKDKSGGRLNDTWFFNNTANTWSQITFTTSTPTKRYGHAMATTASGVLLFGGYYYISGDHYLDDTWLFNTATSTWGQITGSLSTPVARRYHAMAAIPSGVLLFGGYGSGGSLDDTWLFNTSTNSWSQVSTSPTPPARYQHAMATTASGVLLFGGYGSGGRLNDTWLFNTATNTWLQVSTSPTPTARWAHAMAATPSGVLLFGGYYYASGDHYLDDTWLYNTATNTWGQITGSLSTPVARRYHAMAAIHSGVLLFEGENSSYQLLNDTWLYGPTSAPTITVSSPTAGATWVVNQSVSITWTSTDVTGPCTVDLSRNGGETWETLTTTAPEQGTYSWMVTGAASADCLVRVTDGTVTGTSVTFTIAAHSETVDHLSLSPASAALQAGTSTDYALIAYDTFTNAWDVTSLGAYIIVEPGAGGTWTSTNRYIAGNAGQWTVSASYGSKSATAQLTVSATLHLSSPVGGEDWIRGHTYSINWTSTGVTGTTTLALSRDNGATWETLTTTTATSGTFPWTVTTPRTSQALVKVYSSGQSDQSPAVFRLRDPQIGLSSPIGGELWGIGSQHAITWTSTDLDGTTLTILLARNGIDFTETLTIGVDAGSGSWNWTVSGPGTINAKVRLVEADCQDSSPAFFTISIPYAYSGATITTTDPWLEISGGTGPGTLWVIPLDPQYTNDPNLNQFSQGTGKRSALFFDIRQQGLTGTLTIVLHYTPQPGEETFVLYCWDGTGWVLVPGTLNTASHTFTFTIDTALLTGTPFGLGGEPVAMPGMSPWALALLSFSLLGVGGWWFLRRRRLA